MCTIGEQLHSEKLEPSFGVEVPLQRIKPNHFHTITFEKILGIIQQDDRYVPKTNETKFICSDKFSAWTSNLQKLMSKKIQIKQLKNVQTFKLSIGDIDFNYNYNQQLDIQEDFKKFIAVITKNPMKFKKVDLRIIPEMPSKYFKSAIHLLGKLSYSIKYLNLELPYCQTDSSAKHINLLINHVFEKLKNLVNLKLNFEALESYLFSFITLELLSSLIGRYLINLNTLEINFGIHIRLVPKELKEFASKIGPRMTRLQKFKFFLPAGYRICEENLIVFLNTICANFTNLKHLEFSLSYEKNIAARSLWSIFSIVSQRLTQLEYLDLNFSSHDTEEVKPQTLLCNPLASLKILKLRLGRRATSEDVLRELIPYLVTVFPKLEHFAIKNNGLGTYDLSVKGTETILFDMGSCLDNLQSMWIDISGLNFDLKNWQYIQKTLPHLKELTLNSSKFYIISNKDYLELLIAWVIKFLSRLGRLILIFDLNWNEIMYDHLEALATRVTEGLTNLKYFALKRAFLGRDELRETLIEIIQ